jgi:gliding motility-associated-like protein
VTVRDQTQCPPRSITKTLGEYPVASFAYSAGNYCTNDPSNPLPAFTGGGQAGIFSATPAGLVFVNANTGEINLAASAPGQYTITNTVTISGPCPVQSASAVINLLPAPVITSTSTASICTGATLGIQLNANFSSTFSWIASNNPGVSGESLTTQNTGTINNTLTNNTTGVQTVTYTVIPTATINGGCTGNPQTVNVTVYPMDNAGFNYSAASFCATGTDPNPVITGLPNGAFSISGGGSISSSTGTIDLSASAIGSHTVTYTTNGTCPNSSAVNVSVTPGPSAAFSYSSPAYCKNASNPSAVLAAGASAGVFSSTAGLIFVNNTTGQINLTASTPGTYVITNTIAAANGCSATSASATVTISPYNPGTFSYEGSPFCSNAANPLPVFTTGSGAGTFSSASGLVINSSTGEVNLSASIAGTYTVINTVAANSGCPSVSSSSSITITSMPAGVFTYNGSPFCQTAANPQAVLQGNNISGTFSSTPGLDINPATGEINLAASSAGSYTVYNTIAANAGCPQVTESTGIVVTPLPSASFNYTLTPYCQNESNPAPAFNPGSAAGIFTSASGLSLNTSTGEVDLALSSPGTYTVTNTIAASGGCPAVIETAEITITALPVALFSYTNSPYCQVSSDPFPFFLNNGVAGVFASTAGLNINASTGEIDLSGSTPGTYTVTNTISAANGCPVVQESAPVSISALPVAAFAYTLSSYCQTAADPSPTYTGGGTAGTFTSINELALNTLTGEIDLSASRPGPYTVTNTIAAANGCPAVTETAVITITQLPIATFNYPGSPFCNNSIAQVPVLDTGSTAGVFSSAQGLNIDAASGTINPGACLPGTYTVNNFVAAANGCPDVSASSTVTITALPSADFNYSSPVYCINEGNVMPVFTSGSAGTFTSAAGISIDPLSGEINLGASSTGSYVITNTIPATNGCSEVSESFTLAINQIAVADAGPDAAICGGNVYALSGAVSGSASTVTWTSNGSGTFDDASSLSAKYTPSVNDISAGSVELTLTTNDPAGPCGSASDLMVLIIEPAAVANASSDAVICSGNSYIMNGNISGGASSLTWSTSGSGSFNDPASAAAIYTPSSADIAAGSVSLLLTTNDPAGECPAVSDEMLLTINPAAVVDAGTDVSICQGTSYPAVAALSGGATSLVWTSNGSGTFANPSSLTAIYTPAVSDVSMGSVILTATTNDPAGPCAAVSDEMILTLIPRDNPSFAYSTTAYCETGTDPSPVINGMAGGVFSVFPGGLMINPSTGAIDLSASPLGTYTITYTTPGSCPDSASAAITVIDGLSAGFSYASPSYCSNAPDPTPVLASGANAGVFSGDPGIVIDPVSGIIDLSASTPGTYTVMNTVAASGGCAQASSASSVTINQQDDASFHYASASFCKSSPNQTPMITGAAGGSFSCGAGLSIAASGEIAVSACSPGTYPVIYTTSGICPNSDTVSVTINALPVVDAGNERLIDCGANPINIEVIDSSGNVVNYSWNTNGGNILAGGNSNMLSVNQTGVYYVVATNTWGCASCDTIIVNESPAVPEASFAAATGELSGIAPFDVTFENTSINANVYSWNFGDGGPETSDAEPQHTFNAPGEYTVTLIASNNGRCSDTTEVKVKVNQQFFIPEGFSPNGDGINDVFVIRGIDRYRGNKFVVFNRWGNQVHASSPYTNEWDGSTSQDIQIGGNELPTGTYFYVLDLGDGSAPYKGYIYLQK